MRHPKLLASLGLIFAVFLSTACGDPGTELAAIDRAAQTEVQSAIDINDELARQQLVKDIIRKADEDAAAQAAAHRAEERAKAQRERQARAAAAQASRSAKRGAVERPVVTVSGDIWGALARCESGGNPRAVGGGGRYFGAFQFSLGSWRAVGMSGNPVDYDYATQLAAAQRLQARSGWGQWPHCSRRLGLR